METGKLNVDAVKFFVLDEADRLLDTGNLDVILKMFQRFPKASSGTHRLQVSPPLISQTCIVCCKLHESILYMRVFYVGRHKVKKHFFLH